MAKQTASATTARLFDADKADKKFELTSEAVGAIGERQLLWVDVLLGDDATDDEAFLDMLPFGREEVTEWWDSTFNPRLTVHGDYFLARVVAIPPTGPADKQVVLDLAVGKNVILTAHRDAVEFLNLINTRIISAGVLWP